MPLESVRKVLQIKKIQLSMLNNINLSRKEDVPGESGTAGAPSKPYFSRRVRIIGKLKREFMQDEELLSVEQAVVILGEPGMGKSEMIRHLSFVSGTLPVPASRFIQRRDPKVLLEKSPILFIDALDEAVARSSGDAVNQVLAQLEDAGSPPFILTCRAREWESGTHSSLKQMYGRDPLVVSIDDLSREEAQAFWQMQGFKSDAVPVLDRMDEQNLSALYKNPLTLIALGAVADSGEKLPATRAELFTRVCRLGWREHNEGRKQTELARLTEDQALSTAGAIMAALILSGSEAISLGGEAFCAKGDVLLEEIDVLPGSKAVRAVVGSKLFQNAGFERVVPVHRVIAEFLGAKWLADHATSALSRRRLMAQFQGAGAVPSSLRGMHAWLAYHSPALALSVIRADPFGFLRYGESSAPDAARASALLDSLEALALSDPHFRTQDWDARTAVDLVHPSLIPRIRSIIEDQDRNSHLRSVVLESIKGAPIAEDLAASLEHLVLSDRRSYWDRELAMSALQPIRKNGYWEGLFEELLRSSSDESARISRRILEITECKLPNTILARVFLADLDLLHWSEDPTRHRYRIRVHIFEKLVKLISPRNAKEILQLLTRAVSGPILEVAESNVSLQRLFCLLLLCSLHGRVIGTRDASAMWSWLYLAGMHAHREKIHREQLLGELRKRDDLRHAIQEYGIWKVCREKRLHRVERDLKARMISILDHPGDAAYFLRMRTERRVGRRRFRDDWRDLVRLGVRAGAENSQILDAARCSMRPTIATTAFLRKTARNATAGSRIQDARDRDEELARRHMTSQRQLMNLRAEAQVLEIRRGSSPEIVLAAQAYLGMSMWDASVDSWSPEDRLVAFCNESLAQEFMNGFEATLRRRDLPAVAELAEIYASRRMVGDFSYPLIAGLLSRVRSARGFKDVPANTIQSGLLLCVQQATFFADDEHREAIIAALQDVVASTAEQRQRFVRLWIEPMLHRHAIRSAEYDLRWLAERGGWWDIAGSLAREWLSRFRQTSLDVECELVSILVATRGISPLVEAARERDSGVFESEAQAFFWLAIDVAYRFDEVRPNLSGIGQENLGFIWQLRDRIRPEGKVPVLPVNPRVAKWIVSEFRGHFPHTELRGIRRGLKNSYDASAFLLSLVQALADQAGDEAVQLLADLADEPADGYTDFILHRASEQRQKRAEQRFEPVAPNQLAAILSNGAPSNIDDLRSVVLEELQEVQGKLLGDELDQVQLFWADDGSPYEENRCRDRLAALIDTRLGDLYEIKRMTEADMPKDKRADLVFAKGSRMQLPMEIKGQWHDEVWDAASSQLDARYLVDWRSEGRGIYCVFWFGEVKAKTHRRLKAHPDGLPAPTSSSQMRSMLVDRIPQGKRPFIDVVVLDLATGRKSA